MTMTLKELQELMKLMKRHNLVEFNMKDGEFEISMRSEAEASPAPPLPMHAVQAPTYAQPGPPPAQAAPAPVAAAPAAATKQDDTAGEGKLVPIKSPMPGTFYRASSPDKPPFAKVGDVVEAGQVVCVIEAMKLFNELESEIGGRIVKVLVEDAQPVEYDQVLFMVEP